MALYENAPGGHAPHACSLWFPRRRLCNTSSALLSTPPPRSFESNALARATAGLVSPAFGTVSYSTPPTPPPPPTLEKPALGVPASSTNSDPQSTASYLGPACLWGAPCNASDEALNDPRGGRATVSVSGTLPPTHAPRPSPFHTPAHPTPSPRPPSGIPRRHAPSCPSCCCSLGSSLRSRSASRRGPYGHWRMGSRRTSCCRCWGSVGHTRGRGA